MYDLTEKLQQTEQDLFIHAWRMYVRFLGCLYKLGAIDLRDSQRKDTNIYHFRNFYNRRGTVHDKIGIIPPTAIPLVFKEDV